MDMVNLKAELLKTKIVIKLFIIIALLFPFLKMPYWYFQLLHIFGTIGFAYLAYKEYKENIKFTPKLFAIAAVIFNPIIKIAFHRQTWLIIDMILVVLIFLSIILDKKYNEKII